MGWDGIVSTASIEAFLRRWSPLPPQLTLQGVVGSPALDSGLQHTIDPNDPDAVNLATLLCFLLAHLHTHTHTHTMLFHGTDRGHCVPCA